MMIRSALPSDVAQIAELHVRSWQVAYRGHMPDGFLNKLDPLRRAAWWTETVADPKVTVFVALEGSALRGFCSFLSCRDEDLATGICEIATLYVDPDKWRLGCGSSLVEAVVAAARERSFHGLSLWVLATNVAARVFYESMGFSPDGATKTDSRLGVELQEIRFRRELLTA